MTQEHLSLRSIFQIKRKLKNVIRKGNIMTSKYDPLRDYLKNLPDEKTRKWLTFTAIEKILGFKLPPSAYNYKVWWNNESGDSTHSHAQSWMSVGFLATNVQQMRNGGSVEFVRKS